jgi:DNA topoisomerase-3
MVNSLSIKERSTNPKEHYTDASLLSVMEHIDREIDDTDLKAFVKQRGLGTPATRAGIIEKLIHLNFVERSGKKLMATSLGIQLIEAVPPAVKDVDITAVWEQMLADIEKGKMSEDDLLQDVIQNITVLVALEQGSESSFIIEDKKVAGSCPRCQKRVFESGKSYYCEGFKDDPKCTFSLWKQDRFFTIRGKSITPSIAMKLLQGKQVLLKGCKKKDGSNEYDAWVSLKDDGQSTEYELSFPSADDASVGSCPKCKKRIFESDKSFYCEGFKDSPKCTFSIWKSDSFFKESGNVPTAGIVKKWLLGKSQKFKVKGREVVVSIDCSGQYVKYKKEYSS